MTAMTWARDRGSEGGAPRAARTVGHGHPRRAAGGWPMRLALLAVAGVWLLGCVWSFHEQSAFASSRGFSYPHLLPLVIDGFAIAMAGVSWAASLDARTALSARIATLLAVAGSAASNGAWAWDRTGHDPGALALAVAVPVAANLAFEVLLAEVRRQVQRHRGLPAPVAIPYPRLVRVALAPVSTAREWRGLVLHLTAPSTTTDSAAVVAGAPTSGPRLAPPPATTATPDSSATSAPPVSRSGPGSTPDTAVGAPTSHVSTPIPAPVPAEPGWQRSPSAPEPETRPLIGDRPLDPRAAILAAKLAQLADPRAVTGPDVGELLGEPLAARTGRRLLQQARVLISREQAAAAVADRPLALAGSPPGPALPGQ